jgi:hypothetical protein
MDEYALRWPECESDIVYPENAAGYGQCQQQEQIQCPAPIPTHIEIMQPENAEHDAQYKSDESAFL